MITMASNTLLLSSAGVDAAAAFTGFHPLTAVPLDQSGVPQARGGLAHRLFQSSFTLTADLQEAVVLHTTIPDSPVVLDQASPVHMSHGARDFLAGAILNPDRLNRANLEVMRAEWGHFQLANPGQPAHEAFLQNMGHRLGSLSQLLLEVTGTPKSIHERKIAGSRVNSRAREWHFSYAHRDYQPLLQLRYGLNTFFGVHIQPLVLEEFLRFLGKNEELRVDLDWQHVGLGAMAALQLFLDPDSDYTQHLIPRYGFLQPQLEKNEAGFKMTGLQHAHAPFLP